MHTHGTCPRVSEAWQAEAVRVCMCVCVCVCVCVCGCVRVRARERVRVILHALRVHVNPNMPCCWGLDGQAAVAGCQRKRGKDSQLPTSERLGPGATRAVGNRAAARFLTGVPARPTGVAIPQ